MGALNNRSNSKMFRICLALPLVFQLLGNTYGRTIMNSLLEDRYEHGMACIPRGDVCNPPEDEFSMLDFKSEQKCCDQMVCNIKTKICCVEVSLTPRVPSVTEDPSTSTTAVSTT